MNEEPKPTTPKRRKSKTPRTPRTRDPGIEALQAEHRRRIAAYRSLSASERILKTILTKRLDKLTGDDRQNLFDELAKTCTPSFGSVATVQEKAAQ